MRRFVSFTILAALIVLTPAFGRQERPRPNDDRDKRDKGRQRDEDRRRDGERGEREEHWYHEAHLQALPIRPQDLVQTWYRKYLHREPDPDGLATWNNALSSGQAPEAVLATLLGSQEYYDRCGDTPDGFVRTAFQDITGRAPSPSEYAYWTGRMTFMSSKDVAYAILTRYPQAWGTPPALRDVNRYEYRGIVQPYRR